MPAETRRLAVLFTLAASFASAQSVISVHSGVLHVTEGAVFRDDQAVDQKLGTFPDLKEKSVLRTEMGRAELLLTPGVFLRVGENSSVKMLDNRLADTRVEVLSGRVVLESDDPMKENSVTIVYRDYQVHVRRAGVMEFESNPDQLRVFSGEAEVELNGSLSIVKAGRLMPFTAALAQEKFDVRNTGDALTRWSQQRSEYVSVANLSAAKSLRDSGATMSNSSWYYNPFYSMYTYIPLNGVYWNPYGFGFFSPYTVYEVYNQAYYGGGGGGSTYTARPRASSPGVGGARNASQVGFNGPTSIGEPSFGRGSWSGPASSGVASAPAAGPSFGASGAGAAAGGAARGAGGGRSR